MVLGRLLIDQSRRAETRGEDCGMGRTLCLERNDGNVNVRKSQVDHRSRFRITCGTVSGAVVNVKPLVWERQVQSRDGARALV